MVARALAAVAWPKVVVNILGPSSPPGACGPGHQVGRPFIARENGVQKNVC